MASIKELLNDKGMNLFNVVAVETDNRVKVETKIQKKDIFDMTTQIFIIPIVVKEPKYFNEAARRWLCPDHTTNLTICSSNKQSKECKPNCAGCVLRREMYA